MRYDVIAAVLGSIGCLLVWWGSEVRISDTGAVTYTFGPGAPFLVAGFVVSLIGIYKIRRA